MGDKIKIGFVLVLAVLLIGVASAYYDCDAAESQADCIYGWEYSGGQCCPTVCYPEQDSNPLICWPGGPEEVSNIYGESSSCLTTFLTNVRYGECYAYCCPTECWDSSVPTYDVCDGTHEETFEYCEAQKFGVYCDYSESLCDSDPNCNWVVDTIINSCEFFQEDVCENTPGCTPNYICPTQPTCDDGILNQNEFCIDRGGECAVCDNDGTCDTDCGENVTNCAGDCVVDCKETDTCIEGDDCLVDDDCLGTLICDPTSNTCVAAPVLDPVAYWADLQGYEITPSSWTYPYDGDSVKLIIENYPLDTITFHIWEKDFGADEDLGTITGTVTNGVAVATWTMDDGDFTEDPSISFPDRERKTDGIWSNEHFEFYFEVEGVDFDETILDTGYSQSVICTSGDPDCGTDGWVGSPTCNGDDVWQDYITYSCESNVCSDSTNSILNKSCEYGCDGGVCNTNIPCPIPNLPTVCSSYNSYESEGICNSDNCEFANLTSPCDPSTQDCSCVWTGTECGLENPTREFCDDGTCNNGETTATCPEDCEVTCATEGLTCEYGWNCNAEDTSLSGSCGAAQVCCTQVRSSSSTPCALEEGTCTYESNCDTALPGYDCNLANTYCCDVLNSEVVEETCEDTDTCAIGDFCTLDSDCITNNCIEGICSFDSGDNNYGSCLYTDQTPETDTCEDGYISYSWTGEWDWADNVYASQESCGSDCIEDPINSGIWHIYTDNIAEAFTECDVGSEELPCPAQVQLPFFSWLNLVIAIVLIALVYYFFGMNKRKTGKKKVSRKKKRK